MNALAAKKDRMYASRLPIFPSVAWNGIWDGSGGGGRVYGNHKVLLGSLGAVIVLFLRRFADAPSRSCQGGLVGP